VEECGDDDHGRSPHRTVDRPGRPGEEAGRNFVALVKRTFPGWARIAIGPEAVHILDLGAGRFPSAWSVGQHL
jgi:hypothetical protein